jgi:hypothetical protein
MRGRIDHEIRQSAKLDYVICTQRRSQAAVRVTGFAGGKRSRGLRRRKTRKEGQDVCFPWFALYSQFLEAISRKKGRPW